jgi:hypothetical protein
MWGSLLSGLVEEINAESLTLTFDKNKETMTVKVLQGGKYRLVGSVTFEVLKTSVPVIVNSILSRHINDIPR